MKKRILTAILLTGTLILSACAENKAEAVKNEKTKGIEEYVSLAPNVTAQMCQADYWIESVDKPDELLMTAEEVQELNKKILACADTYTSDLTSVDTRIDGKAIQQSWADGIQKPDHDQYYTNGKKLVEEDYQSYQDNILNFDATNNMEVKYGICTDKADLYGCPETQIVTDDPEDPEYNEFQTSVIRVNQPVLINGETADGLFYHVIAYDCEGWALKEKIARCSGRDEWIESSKAEGEKLIVTGDKIRLNASMAKPELSEKILTMGTTLTLVPEENAPDMVGNRSTWGSYVVKIPARDTEGNYYQEYALISLTEDVNVGYLDMTKANIIRVAMKQLGNRYGWGGMLNAVDCSAYIQEIYACFGLNLPRNSSWQAAIPAQKITLTEDMTEKERGEVLDSIPTGAILQWSGHVMLNLGKVEGRYYVISAAGSMMNPENESGEVSRIRSVLINDLSMKRPNAELWSDQISTAVIFW